MGRAQSWWGVEYINNGRPERRIDSLRHSTPEEAKKALEDEMGIPWKELEKRGARVVQRESEGPPDG
jgi:hypothetical protein